jgi:hypothetical protein
MAGTYDVSLGGISFVTYEQDFRETIGSEYELVGAAVMPGAPRPLSFYDITIPIHAAQDETGDHKTVGDTQRSQIRSLLQNPAARFAGLAFTSSFDPLLDGWLVIGTADLGYNPGGPTFGEYVLRISGAALVPAQITLLAYQLTTQDLRAETEALDPQMRVYRDEPLGGRMSVRHHLPVGAHAMRGQVDPVQPKVSEYQSIFGSGVTLHDRPHGETVTFEMDFADALKSDVRVFDAEPGEQEWSAEGDRDPQEHYGWTRAYGPLFPYTRGTVPVLDNGRARIRHLGGSRFVIETAKGGAYVEDSRVNLGFGELVSARVTEWTPMRGVVRLTLRRGDSTGEAVIALESGWPGPTVDVYDHAGHKVRLDVEGDVPSEQLRGWAGVRPGFGKQEALAATSARRYLIGRG